MCPSTDGWDGKSNRQWTVTVPLLRNPLHLFVTVFFVKTFFNNIANADSTFVRQLTDGMVSRTVSGGHSATFRKPVTFSCNGFFLSIFLNVEYWNTY